MTMINQANKELYQAADSFVSAGLSNRSNFDFRIRRNEYVFVAERDINDAEIHYTLPDWLGAVAVFAEAQTDKEQISNLAMIIEDKVFSALNWREDD